MGNGDWVQGEKEDRAMRAAQRQRLRLADALLYIDDRFEDTREDQKYLREIRIQARYDDRGEILAIIKATGPAGDEIAFQGGPTVSETLMGLSNRLRNGSIKWREDTPYERRDG